MSRGTIQKITYCVLMAGLLIYMLVLSFQDAAQTGEDPELVGPIAAWVAIVLVSLLIIKMRSWLGRLFGRLFK